MSIRARLLVATGIIAVVALVGADIATYTALRAYLYGQIDATLERSHIPVEASVSQSSAPTSSDGQPPGPQGLGDGPCSSFHGNRVDTDGLSPGTYIQVRTPKQRSVFHCTVPALATRGVPAPLLPPKITGFTRTGPSDDEANDEATVYFTAAARGTATGYRVRASVLRSGPEAGGVLVVAVPLTSTSRILADLLNREIAATAGAIVLALLLGWWLVRATLHPLRDVERTAGAIAAGQLSERVPGDEARTEVGHVARAFNVMLGRIESAFAARDRTEAELRASEERMRRFLADASHELRTPLAAVRAYADLFDRGASERPEDLERLLHGIQGEAARMSHLVEDLLLLARLDEGVPLRREPVDLVALAGEAVNTARAVGPQWTVRLRATLPVEVIGDALRLRQVLDNLLANVRQHTPPGTTATVRVSLDDGVALFEVSDDGPGLSPDERRRVFERFFRADPSRSREHGGAGLGLAIVDAIVRAHGGDVTVSAAEEGGARVAVRLPAPLRE